MVRRRIVWGMCNIDIVDVTARDGLQNEARIFSVHEKIYLINKALDAGIKRLEVASFVHPKYVPQMADAEAVIAGLSQSEATYIGLVMNEHGFERAMKTRIDELGFVVIASDSFAQKNQNQTRQGSVDLARRLIERTLREDRRANVTIGASFGCPFEGEVDPEIVIDMAQQLAEAGPHEISVADTIGVGNPWDVNALIKALRAELPDVPIRAHFHNTRNTGLANVHAAIEAGAKTIDVSIGGIGGCPFAPAATGNVPAEDVVYMLQRGGFKTGLDLHKIIETAEWLSQVMEKDMPGMLAKAGIFPQKPKEDKNA